MVFGHADGHEIQAALVGQLRDLVGRIHRVVAADIHEIADVVGTEHVDHPLKVFVLALLQLVAACADRTGGGREPQEGNLVAGLSGEIEEFLLEHAFDAVAGAVDGADGGRRRGPPR